MAIRLDQITFDFNPERSAKEPLSFIKDGARSTETGTSFKPEDFVVTYARSDRAVPEIKIKLSCSDMNLSGAEIRGVPETGNVLGEIPVTGVNFNGGRADEVTLRFPNSTLGEGVQRNTVGWEWQSRRDENEEWLPFVTTRHRVYCIFATPTDPWTKEPFSEKVCEIACNWAQGAQSEVPAATNITKAVFNLGEQGKVSYNEGATYAKTLSLFDLESVLELLVNGVGTSQTLNCDDCASIVSTFGNILGCDLHQSEMRGFFDTNFVRRIGDRGFVLTGFDRHAVAWKDECTANDPLYDSCLQIDADGEPDAACHVTPLQPANLRFGSGSSDQNEYKFCLVSESTANPCNPRPDFRTRRGFGKSYVGQNREKDEPYLRFLKDRYGFDSFSDNEKIGLISPKIPAEDFVDSHPAYAGWKRLQVNKFTDNDLEAIDQIILLFPDNDPSQMVELNVYTCAEAASPKGFLLQLLAQFNSSREIRRAESPLIGAIVFELRDKTMHIVKYHQLIGLVRSVGRKRVSTTKMARAVEEYFVRLRSDTSTALKTKDKFTTGEFNMAHRFGAIWTYHLPDDDGGLERKGTIDITTMEPNGRLDNGRYSLPNGSVRRLEGQAVGNSLVLREFDGTTHRATYNGQLAHESVDMNGNTRLVIVGIRHAETTGTGIVDDALFAQNDSPWVITKP
jgi:hypothetical protein